MKLTSSKPEKLEGKGLRIAVILPRFNDSLGLVLYENTRASLIHCGVEENDIILTRVPGALELPFAAKLIAKKTRPDAIIALGVVIKGETPHFEHVCRESLRGLMDMGLETGIPVIFGVITALNEKQAEERAQKDKLNKGREYAESAIEMASVKKIRELSLP